MKRAWWRDRPVLVTGMTGFVGSAMAARLVGAGARVVGLVRDDVAASHGTWRAFADRVTVVYGDLECGALLERTINEYAIQVVYHLGAQTIVGTANRSPRSTLKANIEGTWNVLEACRGKPHVRAVVVASSDKAYGVHRTLPYREEFPLQPLYPYDVSKACADLLAQCYYHTYHLPVVVTRCANIYGPGDLNVSRIVPETIRSVLQGQRPIIRSDGTPERDYLYVDDAVDLYLLLAEQIEKTRGEVFNAGQGQPISVRRLVQTILRLAHAQHVRPEVQGTGRLPGEIVRQWLDSRKVQRVVGWAPKVSLETGLRKTIAWHRRVLAQDARRQAGS